MSEVGIIGGLRITALRLAEGRLQAVLTGAPDSPVGGLTLTHDGADLPGPALVEMAPGLWHLTADLPARLISDGVQTVVLSDGSGARLGSFTVIGGAPVEGDLRAEVELLRAELDMLKRAFRRHCMEGQD